MALAAAAVARAAAAVHRPAILRRAIHSCLPVAEIRLLDLRRSPILRPEAVVAVPAAAVALVAALVAAPVAEVALAASRLRRSKCLSHLVVVAAVVVPVVVVALAAADRSVGASVRACRCRNLRRGR